jgi:hypothetical protein
MLHESIDAMHFKLQPIKLLLHLDVAISASVQAISKEIRCP